MSPGPTTPKIASVEHLPIPTQVLDIMHTLRERGYEAYVVGGAIRDFFLGRETGNWDLATDCPLDEIMTIFPRVVPTGIRHFTATVLTDGMKVEVSTYRDNDILKDLARRDFTVNAMAYDPISGRFLDPHGGIGDLKERLIRGVADPIARFREDPLRVLRGVRFVSELDFELEPSTKEALFMESKGLGRVARERIRDELHRIISSERPSKGLPLIKEASIAEVIIGPCAVEIQRDGFLLAGRAMEALDRETTSRWACVCVALGLMGGKSATTPRWGPFLDQAEGFLLGLKMSKRQVHSITRSINALSILCESHWSDAGMRKAVHQCGGRNTEEALLVAFALTRAHKGFPPWLVPPRDALYRLREIRRHTGDGATLRPVLNGGEIAEHLGIKPGPRVGEVIEEILKAIYEDPSINTRENLMRILDIKKEKNHRL
jgi:tRNA nucleotidyltransferase/poly(A) polymerase